MPRAAIEADDACGTTDDDDDEAGCVGDAASFGIRRSCAAAPPAIDAAIADAAAEATMEDAAADPAAASCGDRERDRCGSNDGCCVSG